ncbi:hypothetical protein P886_0381 [Alteromonadaceae bacterium 2753L.S.0a.02]|nr:hypothetical protein P886_0381 [Alteromonadaceae bacterium 2753L.S.0a.02]
MKTSITAALYSAAIFPGAGHFWLKSWLPGSVIAAVACYALYSLTAIIITVARDISKKLQSGVIPLDIGKIHDAILNQVMTGGSGSVSFALWLLLGVWVVGVLDAYRVGRAHDKQKNGEADSSN